MMKNLLLCFLLLFSGCVAAQEPPLYYLTQWEGTGFTPDYNRYNGNVANILDFGGKADGVSDNAEAITKAIISLNNRAGIVYFPSGKYFISSTINLPDSIIIRGNGSDSTELIFNSGKAEDHIFKITASQQHTFQPVTGGFQKNSIWVTSSSHNFSPGEYLELRQQNGNWDTKPASWAKYSVGQVLQVASLAGDTIRLSEPLRLNYDTYLEVRKIVPVKGVGIEGIKVTRADNALSGSGDNFFFSYAAGCWLRGVESSYSQGSHVLIETSTNISITGSYFHHAFEYDGAGTHGYGITLIQHTGNCLIQDNIFQTLRHAMTVKQGANGNVFGYNFSTDPKRAEFPSDAPGDISLHGHYPYSNLFEGNIVQTIHIDQAWGPNGPYNAFLHNRAEGYGIIITSGSVGSDTQIFVGNEVDNGALLKGNYILAGGGHFEYANNVNGKVKPNSSGSLSVNSYYLLAKPGFWNIDGNWPSIGGTNDLGTGSNPARERFYANKTLTVFNIYPKASFTADSNVCAGDSLSFINTSQIGSGHITGWLWSFGDGTTSNQRSPIHFYKNAGEYKVSLLATSDKGLQDSFRFQITVLPRPDAIFSYENITGPVYRFTPGNIVPTLSYHWSFGDGEVSQDMVAKHEFMGDGEYRVRLLVSNGACEAATEQMIKVIVTGVEKTDHSTEEDINIYPNPFSNEINIHSSSIKGNVSVNLLDLQGKLIKSWNINDYKDTATLELNVPKGAYIIWIESNTASYTRKLLKQ